MDKKKGLPKGVKKERRQFVRLEETMPCSCRWQFAEKSKEEKGTVLNIGGGGAMVMANAYIEPGTRMALQIESTIGKLEIEGEVVGANRDWYLSDEKSIPGWRMNVKFTGISMQLRKQIINYVYKCIHERTRLGWQRLNQKNADGHTQEAKE